MTAKITFPDQFNLADYYLFERLEEGLGEKTAIRYGGRGYTYAAIAAKSLAFARYLMDAGVAAEERVYIILPDTPPFAWAFFGALKRGAIVTLGNPNAAREDLAYVARYVKAACIVATAQVAADLAQAFKECPHLKSLLIVPDTATGENPEGPVAIAPAYAGAEFLCIPLTAALSAAAASNAEIPPTHRDDMAIWLFTSGSTGKSKAAMHTHRDFAYNTEAYAKRTLRYRVTDVTVSVPRLFFGYATGTNLMFPFAAGASTGLFSERPSPESLAAAIAMYRPAIVTNVPTMMAKLLDYDDELRAAGKPPLDFSSIRFHLSAGEALPPPLLERFQARFKNDVYDGIGSAEMFHIYVSNRPGDIKPGSLGKPVEGYETKILPTEAEFPGAEPVPVGEIGVLWVRGDSVALGYYQDREKSWAAFHGHWCRTGDLFHVTPDGYYWFHGRADDLLKVGGQWVAPQEVEECLMAHPAVSSAAVIGARDAEDLVKPKAFVVLRPEAREKLASDGGKSLAHELQEFVRAKMTKHKYPRWLVFTADLPKNDRGKIDRKSLREADAQNPAPGFEYEAR